MGPAWRVTRPRFLSGASLDHGRRRRPVAGTRIKFGFRHQGGTAVAEGSIRRTGVDRCGGGINLGLAALTGSASAAIPVGGSVLLIDNDGESDPTAGSFASGDIVKLGASFFSLFQPRQAMATTSC